MERRIQTLRAPKNRNFGFGDPRRPDLTAEYTLGATSALPPGTRVNTQSEGGQPSCFEVSHMEEAENK